MNKILVYLFLLFSIILTSCGSSSKVSSYKRKHNNSVYSKINKSNTNINTRNNSNLKESSTLLKKAKSYLGTPYKYGGSSSSGMDCSGLVLLSFGHVGLDMPRNSAEQSKKGKEIKLNQVQKGDLIFFNTSGRSISHVGIIESIDKSGDIKFIHSSTSKGVIVSSLSETYWKNRFVKATRVL